MLEIGERRVNSRLLFILGAIDSSYFYQNRAKRGVPRYIFMYKTLQKYLLTLGLDHSDESNPKIAYQNVHSKLPYIRSFIRSSISVLG